MAHAVPHLTLELKENLKKMSPSEMYHDLVADTLNGASNGVDILIDAEQFNYAFHQSNAGGFKIVLGWCVDGYSSVH